MALYLVPMDSEQAGFLYPARRTLENSVRAKFAELHFRNCPKSLRGVCKVALRAAEEGAFRSFRPP
jgi:hypothetical protein